MALFHEIGFDLKTLVSFIETGYIGLPDIQRPFVWPNTKVRDLFDSIYRGYPVGYLLLWENAIAQDNKPIGITPKQTVPTLLIVDGQQRLTSLYAVLTGTKVVREDYATEHIEIAFDPLHERFEVARRGDQARSRLHRRCFDAVAQGLERLRAHRGARQEA